ncbi:MAG: CARDB domain-containing protein [Acidobacteriota bacterium]
MKILKKTVCMFVAIMLVSVMMVSAQRQIQRKKLPMVRTFVKVELISPANHYVGVCPVTVKMTGKITVSKAMTVKYYFKRSDGVTSRLTPLIFTTAGTKNIPFTWKLGKDGQAWVQLIVKTASGEVKSFQKEFDVKCDKKRKVIKKLTPAQMKAELKPLKMGPARIIGHKAVLKQADDLPKVKPVVADLDIIGLNIQPHPGKIHQDVAFSVVVKNISRVRMEHSPSCYLKVIFITKVTSSSPFNPPYYQEYPHYFVIPEIGSGSKCTIEFKFKFHQIRDWKIFVKADGKDTVKEFKEDNNTAIRPFWIRY